MSQYLDFTNKNGFKIYLEVCQVPAPKGRYSVDLNASYTSIYFHYYWESRNTHL